MSLHSPTPAHTVWTDDELLAALRLRDLGQSFAMIGLALGRTRDSVAGVLKRIDDDLRASEEN